MTKTDENLKAAFAGESQANRLYLAFAKAAEQEGFPQVAKLFKAAAEAETVHALNHLRVMGQVKSTADNLGTAVTGETYEFTKMYPQMIEEAKAEGNNPTGGSDYDRVLVSGAVSGLQNADLTIRIDPNISAADLSDDFFKEIVRSASGRAPR